MFDSSVRQSNVQVGLLANAVHQAVCVLTDTPHSRASPPPQDLHFSPDSYFI